VSRPVSAIRTELRDAYAEASASLPFAPAALRRLVDLLVEGFDALAAAAPAAAPDDQNEPPAGG
jgi:hypothetical protein